MADKLTEEQHQVHKFHLLALAVGVRCVRNKFSQRALGQAKNKEKTEILQGFITFSLPLTLSPSTEMTGVIEIGAYWLVLCQLNTN